MGILDQGECVQRPSELMAEEVRKFESAYRPIHLAEPWTRALAEGTRYVPVAIDGGIELGRQTTGLPGDMETAITERLANHTEQAHHARFKNQTGWHGEVRTLQDFGPSGLFVTEGNHGVEATAVVRCRTVSKPDLL